jgi:hypothetical protein
MTLNISLAPEDETKLSRLAAASGTDLNEYVQRLIRRELEVPLSLVDAAEPLARAVERSGVSDEEFTSIIEQAKSEARAQRRNRESA